ncbi:MAG: H-NS histone family protein [Rhodoferax sp.]|nr:H-NS histone family protein [Rhodoferax sp.]
MNNLIEIQSQINKLQKQASDIKAKEFDKTIQEIVAKMQAFGITLKDLQNAGKRRGKSTTVTAKARTAKVSGKSGTTVAAKYRGPNGETWSGRGLMPRWMRVLVDQGKTKESFLIQP